jgi:casein kinase II subunit alpha
LGTGKFSDVFEAVDVGAVSEKTNTDHDATSHYKQQQDYTTDMSSIEKTTTTTTLRDGTSVVVLKCLKPVSERKIRREVLILQHASKLPNLARIKALVLPATCASTLSGRNTSSTSTVYPPMKTRTKHSVMGVPTLVLEHAGSDCRWLSHHHGGGGGSKTASLLSVGRRNKFMSKSNKDSATTRQITTTMSKDDNIYNNEEEEDDEEDTTLSDYEIRYYVFHLLVALDCLHRKGIMHRDVKPRNCLIRRLGYPPSSTLSNAPYFPSSSTLLGGGENTHSSYSSPDTTKQVVSTKSSPLMLIDLGLADFYIPNQKYNVRVASRHYKAPELLVGYPYYDYALDLWGVGCILASLLCFREPFFRGKDNLDQLGKIIMQLGTTDLLSYILRYNIQLSPEVQQLIQSYHATGHYLTRKRWMVETRKDGKHCAVESRAADLLNHLLVYDHEQRWTARQAMDHPFFDVVRRRVLTEVGSYYDTSVSV